MSNDYSSERFWDLDSVEAITTDQVIIRKIVFYPSAVDQVVIVQEYNAAGSLRSALKLPAGNSDTSAVQLDFGYRGRRLNGFKLSQIPGGEVHVYLGRD